MTMNKQHLETQQPEVILQAAIKELDIFTQSKACRLELGKDGRLIAANENPLERVIGLARRYIVPLFSEQMRQEQAKKLDEIKQAIIQARDTIQNYSAFLEKWKEGNESQRKFAAYALATIQRYNAIVGQDLPTETMKPEVYHDERRRLLKDRDIQGRQIELSHSQTVSIKGAIQRRLKELSQTLAIGAVNNPRLTDCSTHKKTIQLMSQFMSDTFQVKALRMMQGHVSAQRPLTKILQLIQETPVEIEEENSGDLITMRQLLKLDPGSFILVTACFKRNLADSKFMTLDSFKAQPINNL